MVEGDRRLPEHLLEDPDHLGTADHRAARRVGHQPVGVVRRQDPVVVADGGAVARAKDQLALPRARRKRAAADGGHELGHA